MYKKLPLLFHFISRLELEDNLDSLPETVTGILAGIFRCTPTGAREYSIGHEKLSLQQNRSAISGHNGADCACQFARRNADG